MVVGCFVGWLVGCLVGGWLVSRLVKRVLASGGRPVRRVLVLGGRLAILGLGLARRPGAAEEIPSINSLRTYECYIFAFTIARFSCMLY